MAAAIAETLILVAGAALEGCLNARDTVAVETPAANATSFMVTVVSAARRGYGRTTTTFPVQTD
jgi:uncharacterized membrane protein